MIKLGVIGLGHMGAYHASVCQLSQNIQLVAVADSNEQNLQKIKDPNIITATDYHQWLDKVDGVIIAVPTEAHYAVAKDCLLNGKHVLIEKPLTKNLAQAQELFDTAQQKKLVLHVGHVERFNGPIQELKKIINEPYLIECHRMGPFVPRVQKDSVVLDLMIHDLDIVLNFVASPVKSISALGKKVYSQNCDIASVQIGFENGTMAHLVSSRASQIKARSMVIHQKNEFIQLDFTTQDLLIHRQGSSSIQVGADQLKYKQESLIERLFVHKDNPLKQEVECFANAIKTGTNMGNPEQDLPALQVSFQIEKLLGLSA
jgi:predicted dehydrogenase